MEKIIAEKTKEEKEREKRIINFIGLVFFLALAMVGLQVVQVGGSVLAGTIGWLLLVACFSFFVIAILLIDNNYRHEPDKLKRLVPPIFIFGVIIALIASGLDAEVVLTPLRKTFAAFGVCLAVSGIYLGRRIPFF